MTQTPTMQDEQITPEDLKRAGMTPKAAPKETFKQAVQAAQDAVRNANEAEDNADEQLKEPDDSAFPAWVKIPEGFKPPKGRQIVAMRFRASWTDTPRKGDRQCIVWSLSEGDEKNAVKRTRGESALAMNELSKQMIRVVDGHVVDWSGSEPDADINTFWNEIGARCRQLIKNTYGKMHTLEPSEIVDFFYNCQAVRSVG